MRLLIITGLAAALALTGCGTPLAEPFENPEEDARRLVVEACTALDGDDPLDSGREATTLAVAAAYLDPRWETFVDSVATYTAYRAAKGPILSSIEKQKVSTRLEGECTAANAMNSIVTDLKLN